MHITLDIWDINGEPLSLGDMVLGYGLEHEVVGGDGGNVVEVDLSRPKPVKDIILFRGTVEWNQDLLALTIRIHELFAKWETGPSSVRMSDYQYQRLYSTKP